MSSRVVVVAPTELEAGFRLAGATVTTAADANQAADAVAGLVAGGERGVIAVYEPYLESFDLPELTRLLESVSPVIVALPAGIGAEGAAGRRARLAGLLQRAVGYHITFGGGAP